MKLAFHRIIRVGNVIYLLLGIVQYIIFSTIPTLGQTPEPYGIGLNALQVGGLQLPQALVFVILGPIAGMIAVKYGNLKFIIPGSIVLTVGILVLTFYHSYPSRDFRLIGVIRCWRSICDIISKCDYILHTA